MDYEQKYNEALERARKWYNKTEPDSYTCIVESIFPELNEPKESENEKIRKWLIAQLQIKIGDNATLNNMIYKAIAWLEKQGGQDAITFNNAHIIDHALNEYCCKQYGALYKENGGVLSFARLQHLAMDIYGWCKKQGEQKPVDNVEPKFKIGDWVVFVSQSIYQVEKIENGYYILRHTHGGTFRVCVLHDESLRLWTIQDAKDGDALAAHECYVIFKEIDGLNIRCHCTYHYMGYNPSFYMNTLQNKTAFHPATKEQRDLLFQKMKEEGYEWDADKKELKKL